MHWNDRRSPQRHTTRTYRRRRSLVPRPGPLFGDGFTLLRLDGATQDITPLEAAARRAALPLTTVDVNDTDVADLYGTALVLVRPDGHVAWRGAEVPPHTDALIDRVRQTLNGMDLSWELVAVDDGSTDGSGERLDEIADDDDHIRVLHFQ